jgi:ABC-type multidrug transport system fused ATPase/permease subunit
MASQQATQIWPGSVGYVPQDVWLFDGSLRDNIFLWRNDVPSEMEVLQILEQANLTTIVQEMPDGLETILGSQGFTLSGGQRQRVGIARALVYKPQLLILDEATSSLDSTSEQSVIESIANLPAETTVIVIAHRLASIMNTERILYMDQGEIIAEGNFQQLRRTVPNFDSQASLMGLA